MNEQSGTTPFISVEDEVKSQRTPSTELAFLDEDFMLSEENRAIRLQLEYLKPERKQRDQKINSTIVIFGSARIESRERAQEILKLAERDHKDHPDDPIYKKNLEMAKKGLEKSHYYEEARRLGHIISINSPRHNHDDFVIVTGGGPGIMEAANRGAYECNTKSIGLNILLPTEQGSNPYISPQLSFQFHYFAIRKMHFLLRARVLIFFPGGFGTLDELFETLTLMQTNKIAKVPLLLFGKKYWSRIINFQALVEEGAIDAADLDLFQYVETAEEAWKIIASYYNLPAKVHS